MSKAGNRLAFSVFPAYNTVKNSVKENAPCAKSPLANKFRVLLTR